MSFLFWALKAKDAVETAIFWKRFKAWQAERDARLAAEKASKPPSVPLVVIAIVAAVMSTAATCGKQIVKDTADLQIYCCVEHPDECRNLPITIPCPATPRPTATPTVAPTLPPSPTATQTAVSTPTLAATATPLPTATLAPTAAPTPDCAPRPGPQPASIAWPVRCPAYMEPIAFEGEGDVQIPPSYGAICAVKAGVGNTRTSWRLGYGVARQGLAFRWHGPALIQEEEGRGCVDAFGRHFPDCEHIYQHPEGETAPYTHGGYVMPTFCSSSTPTPVPTPAGPTPAPGDCSAVAAIEHGLAGGGHCHAWHLLPDGRVYCVVDSTVRPICDTDHMDNWTSFCGGRTHDPDYDSAAGAQDWTISGAEDRGPHPSNSAQRIIVGAQGATVHVTVCLRPDARTVDGCPIPRKGDSCARPPEWDLPREGDQ